MAQENNIKETGSKKRRPGSKRTLEHSPKKTEPGFQTIFGLISIVTLAK